MEVSLQHLVGVGLTVSTWIALCAGTTCFDCKFSGLPGGQPLPECLQKRNCRTDQECEIILTRDSGLMTVTMGCASRDTCTWHSLLNGAFTNFFKSDRTRRASKHDAERLCSKCCDSDECNTFEKSCPGVDINTVTDSSSGNDRVPIQGAVSSSTDWRRGAICHECQFSTSNDRLATEASSCGQKRLCALGQKCSIKVSQYGSQSNYTMGCKSEKECNWMELTAKRSLADASEDNNKRAVGFLCNTCCDGDECNTFEKTCRELSVGKVNVTADYTTATTQQGFTITRDNTTIVPESATTDNTKAIQIVTSSSLPIVLSVETTKPNTSMALLASTTEIPANFQTIQFGFVSKLDSGNSATTTVSSASQSINTSTHPPTLAQDTGTTKVANLQFCLLIRNYADCSDAVVISTCPNLCIESRPQNTTIASTLQRNQTDDAKTILMESRPTITSVIDGSICAEAMEIFDCTSNWLRSACPASCKV